ncbi:MAG: MBL fold metallo-hydrolase [Planctomycetota bacterium]
MKDGGLRIEVFGDSSLFTRVGKGVSYLVRAGGSEYLLDCGATPFRSLGHEGLKRLRGVVVTHSHEDHRRWFTDLVLYLHYHPDLRRRLTLITSEAIHEEYEKNSKGALERSLSADSRRVVDVPYSDFVEKVRLGPRAKYRVEQRAVCGGEGRAWRVIEAATAEEVPPDRAKVFVNPAANRPRMLMRDRETGEWIEPESYYPFSATEYYEADRSDLVDEETGLRFRASKAPTWHGPPTIGVLIELGDERVAFSSDTVYDPELWRELAETKRPLPPEAGTKAFAEAHVVEGDINDYIERIWSPARYEEAMRCYDGAVVVHDADFERSVVHTSHSKLKPDADWRRLILTHTPDGFASLHPVTFSGKRYLLERRDIFEEVDGHAFPLDAELHFKAPNDTLVVGYRNDSGDGRLWETPRGLAVEVGHDRPPTEGAKRLGRFDLYVDIEGSYFPAGPFLDGSGRYRVRSDGKHEFVTETPEGSSGRIVESCRGKTRGG